METIKGKKHTALTIAGSDSSGGAGIQADLKTFFRYGIYGMSVITAVTAQNTQKVAAIEAISAEMVEKQIQSVCEDIFPDAIKIGMLYKKETICAVAKCLEKIKVKHVILDPILISSSGQRLLMEDAVKQLKEVLFPLAELITPNLPETEFLVKNKIQTLSDRVDAAEKLWKEYGCQVLIKGGHGIEDANDVLFSGEKVYILEGERITSHHTHGTGCALSAAITANLAAGKNRVDAVKNAKEYVKQAILHAPSLGHGNGPIGF